MSQLPKSKKILRTRPGAVAVVGVEQIDGPDPSKPSSAHKIMAPRINLVNTLMGGTESLRAAGETFLPRHKAESELNWHERLARAYLVNYFARTVDSLVGKPFSIPIVISDDMPEQLQTISEDVDRQGNNIDTFARRVFQDALTKSFTHILVEFPDTTEANVETLADERNLYAMPYFVHIHPENVLAAYCEYRNGQEFLTQVRIRETETTVEGFNEITTTRIRVLYPGRWELWEQVTEKKWEIVKEGVTTLSYIPLVTIYFDREDFMVGEPPLKDLAYLNVAHWQSNSDQTAILTVARFPMLAGKGISDEEANVEIGPKKFLSTVDPNGEYYYVENEGKAIAAGRTSLEDLKGEMSILGIELLQKSGNPTATAKAIDSAENLSMLQACTLLFQDGLDQAYKYAAQWLGLTDAGSVKINTDFGLTLNNASDVPALQAVRTTGDISRITLLNEFQRRGILSEDFDAEEDQTHLDDEKLKQAGDAAWQKKLIEDGLVNQPTDPNAPKPVANDPNNPAPPPKPGANPGVDNPVSEPGGLPANNNNK